MSPSSLSVFEEDQLQYFIRYIAEPRPPREPQGKPASVGSAFDAYIKAELSGQKFGDLFEAQVEEQNRDFALEAGKWVYDCYRKTPAYEELRDLVSQAVEARFEFTATGEIDGVPLLGKPDCSLKFASGLNLISDWKVSGFCGSRTTSPNPGYRRVWNGFEGGRNHGDRHKLFKPMEILGLEVSESALEDINESWADQLCTYGWCSDPSCEFVYSIHQITAKPSGVENRPLLRVADYRATIRAGYRDLLAKRYRTAWDAISTGTVVDPFTAESICRAAAVINSHPAESPIHDSFRIDFRG